jgi:hypothetical protein
LVFMLERIGNQKLSRTIFAALSLCFFFACEGTDSSSLNQNGNTGGTNGHMGGNSGTSGSANQESHNGSGNWSEPNEYSWDGSWKPSPDSFPIQGMLDETHSQLPPGKWGWDGSCNCPGDEGLAIYNNEFVEKGLDFKKLADTESRHFGWRLIGTNQAPMSLNHRGDNYEGTPGVDLFDLGSNGQLQGTGPSDTSPGINLGDGPDMLRYGLGWSVDMRVGDELRGSAQDNDLVILGTNKVLETNEYDIKGTTIHTGPGSDLVFVRNFGPAAIDLGNGKSGRTDALDPGDGADMVVLEGNMRDFRIYGGSGNDTFVWYVEQVRDSNWLGPNFFGGGGWGDALWKENGKDRLILVVDPNTEIFFERGLHDKQPGSLLSMVYDPYNPTIDKPTENDPFARYYGTAPEGPHGERTITLSFRSKDGTVFTHDFYTTSVELIQLGLGDKARVFDVNQSTGELVPSQESPILEVPARSHFEEIFQKFGRLEFTK